jgi:hypothetical protein
MTNLSIALVWLALGVPSWRMLHYTQEGELVAASALLLGPLVWATGLVLWVSLLIVKRLRGDRFAR